MSQKTGRQNARIVGHQKCTVRQKVRKSGKGGVFVIRSAGAVAIYHKKAIAAAFSRVLGNLFGWQKIVVGGKQAVSFGAWYGKHETLEKV